MIMQILTQKNILFDQVDLEDLTSEGEFDGRTNCSPNKTKWSNLSYRNGYLVGQGYFYDKKFGIDRSNRMPF